MKYQLSKQVMMQRKQAGVVLFTRLSVHWADKTVATINSNGFE